MTKRFEDNAGARVHVQDNDITGSISTGASYTYSEPFNTKGHALAYACFEAATNDLKYKIQRGPTASGPWVDQVAESDVTTSATSDETLTVHAPYYRIGARDGASGSGNLTWYFHSK